MCFPKPNPWIKTNPISVNADIQQCLAALFQVNKNIFDDIVVGGIILHRLRCALHMHRADTSFGVGRNRRHVSVTLQPGYVIDDFRTGGDTFACHFGFGCIDGNWRRRLFVDSLNNFHGSLQFLGFGNCGRIRTRTFPADINNPRAVRNQLQSVINRGVYIGEFASIGKAVGRDVDDAHQHRQPTKINLSRTKLPTVRCF